MTRRLCHVEGVLAAVATLVGTGGSHGVLPGDFDAGVQLMKLTVFYDGRCPLCLAEMRQLKASDHEDLIRLEDINAANFSSIYPHIDPDKADRILHGQLDSGEVLLGLDVTCKAWSLVGKHKWLAMLRWPLIRRIADLVYLGFARYRHSIAYFMTGKPRCVSCSLETFDVDSRQRKEV